MMKHLATTALIASLLLVGACKRDDPPPAASSPPVEAKTILGRTVAKAVDNARRELREDNLKLDLDYVKFNGRQFGTRRGDLPAAEITPGGQLIVSGRPVAMDDHGRALARDYRESVIAVAETGMVLGVQGADLGMKAASEAIASIFRGDTDEVERRIEAEAEAIKEAALQLCNQLPPLLRAQDALAAAVPEFAPYARMTVAEIDSCQRDIGEDGAPGDPAAEADAAATAV